MGTLHLNDPKCLYKNSINILMCITQYNIVGVVPWNFSQIIYHQWNELVVVIEIEKN